MQPQRLDLRLRSLDLVADLHLPLTQLLGLAPRGLQPRREQPALTLDQQRHFGPFGGDLQQLGVEAGRVGAVLLGLQPPDARENLVESAFLDRQFAAQQPVVEADQQGARRHFVALLDKDLGDHAAVGVLHDLLVGLDLQPPRRHHRAGDGRERRPGAKAEHQNKGRDGAQTQRAARAPLVSRGAAAGACDQRGHASVPPGCCGCGPGRPVICG